MTSRLLVDKIEGKTTSNTVQMPQGHVIQTVEVQNTSSSSTTSTSFVDSGLSATITPKFSTSKVLCQISAGIGNTGTSADIVIQVLRGSTQVLECARLSFNTGGHGNAQQFFQVLDSPSTTSATTYKLQMKADGGTTRLNDSASNGNGSSSIVLQEIAQ